MHRRILLPLSVFASSWAFFLFKMNESLALIYDEKFYVPAARQFLATGVNWNWSHPPLGKLLIALGMGVYGDTPLGWRITATFFGALTVLGMFYWSFYLFQKYSVACWVAAITALNQVLFVQARIAMLDVFMFGFSCWALALFSRSYMNSRGRIPVISAALLGLAIAVKWIAVFPLLVCGLLWFYKSRKPVQAFVLFPGIAILFYFAAYLPCIGMIHPNYAPQIRGATPPATTNLNPPVGPPPTHATAPEEYHFSDFFKLQFLMLRAQLHAPNRDIPQQSRWWQWPFALNGVIYERVISKVGETGSKSQDFLRETEMIGNPFILWTGFLAVLVCAVQAIRKRDPVAQLIALSYFSFIVFWIFIEGRGTFYFYYFPSATILGLALVYVFQSLQRYWEKRSILNWAIPLSFLVVSGSVFLFFYPVLNYSEISLSSPQLQRGNSIYFLPDH